MIELSTFYICITARGFAHLRSDDGDVNLHFPCCPQTSPFWVGHHTGGVPFLWAVPFWFWFLGCVLNSRIERSEVRLGNVELESFESIYFNVITQFDHFLQLPSEISAKWVFYHPELQTPSGKTVSSYVMQRNQWSHLGLWRRPRPLASSDVECLEMRNEPSTQVSALSAHQDFFLPWWRPAYRGSTPTWYYVVDTDNSVSSLSCHFLPTQGAHYGGKRRLFRKWDMSTSG